MVALHARREVARQLGPCAARTALAVASALPVGDELHADAGGRLAVQARRGGVGLARRARCGPRPSGARWSRRGWRAARCCRTARRVVSWPVTTTVAAMPWPATLGRSPMVPEDTWAFCARMAALTSAGDRLKPDQLGRVDPDAHGALGAEQLGLADAGHALDFGQHVARGVVAQRDRVDGRVVRRQDGEQQEVGARLVHAHALLRHRRRQARRGARTGGSARRPAPGRRWCRARS